jgi:type IV pilus assembly protein PilB
MALQRINKLGRDLMAEGSITEEQLAAALREQERTGERLGEILVNMEFITPAKLIGVLARRLGVKGCHLRHGLIDPKVARMLAREEAERLSVLPMFLVRGRLTVAMAEPQSLPTIDRLAKLLKCEIHPVLALESNIAEFSAKYLSKEVNVESFLVSLQESDVEVVERESIDEGPVTDLDRMIEGSPIINLVNLAVLTAIRDGASDIHVEPDKKGTRVRYRIDGVLRELMAPPPGMHAAIVSRVKVIGKMDIAEKRLPQEGRVHIVAEGREIDLRVSSMPTILGEKVVMRILDKANLNVRLDALGIRPEMMDIVRRILTQPHGIVLVTGPTGSGKTTTLYSALDLLRDGERNLVTVEDPVEYQLDMVNQIQANDAIGLTFPRALRSILRQDPDVIMVGEIRDADTARVAVQAALTGHLVLSTLHTNDAPGAVVRLTDMGIERFLIASALNGVIAQRLARTICKACRTRYFPPKHLLQQVGWIGRDYETLNLYHGEGCRKCHDSGHRGRIGLFEIMELDSTLREMVHNHCDEAELRAHLRAKDLLTLREEGLICVQKGVTTLEEILRVTHAEDPEAEETRGRKRVPQPNTRQTAPQDKPHPMGDQPVGAVASRA